MYLIKLKKITKHIFLKKKIIIIIIGLHLIYIYMYILTMEILKCIISGDDEFL